MDDERQQVMARQAILPLKDAKRKRTETASTNPNCHQGEERRREASDVLILDCGRRRVILEVIDGQASSRTEKDCKTPIKGELQALGGRYHAVWE